MKSIVKNLLFAVGGVILYKAFFYIKRYFDYDNEEAFWESHPFEDALEKGTTFVKLATLFKKTRLFTKKNF